MSRAPHHATLADAGGEHGDHRQRAGARGAAGRRQGEAGLIAWVGRHRLELRFGLRLTAAALATYAVAQLLGLEQGYWAVLTAVIVMQASLGGSLQAMLDRLVGTIGGAAAGIAAVALVPRIGPATTGLALAVALAPLALLVAFRPAYRVAPVTAVIVVLAARGPPLESGLARTLEIGLGTLVAFAVALLVLPSRAHDLLLAAARDALAAIAAQIALLLDDLAATPDPKAVLGLHDRIRAAIQRAAEIGREAARERASRISDAPDSEPLVRALRRVSHDLVMLARLRSSVLPEPVRARLAPAAASLSAAAKEFTGAVAGRQASSPAPVLAAMRDYGEAMAVLRREGLTRGLSGDAVEQVFGLAFAIEQLCRNLEELGNRAAEFVGGRIPGSAADRSPPASR